MGRFVFQSQAEEETKRIRVELPLSLATWVENLAEKSGGKVGDVITQAITFAKANQEKEEKKPRAKKDEVKP